MAGDGTSFGSSGEASTGGLEESGEEDSNGEASETGEEADVSIYDVQQGSIPLDGTLEIRDVITTGVGSNGFFVQEPAGGMYSGIWVFTGMAGGPTIPEVGDVVDIVGGYEEFFGLREINASGGTVLVTLSPGAENAPPAEVLPVSEVSDAWQGVLVRVQGDTFEVSQIGVGPQDDFRVDDSSGATLWVDDDLYDVVGSGEFPGFGVGASFSSIEGPVGFAFDEVRIMPRGEADLQGYQP